MNAPIELLLGKAAIGAGDDILAPHEPREAQNAFGYEFGVLHDACAVADDARGQDLAFRQLDVLPDAPFVFVAGIGALEGDRGRARGQRTLSPGGRRRAAAG